MSEVAEAFELRILSGMHAGARAELDGDEHTLGAHGDCDFILADAGVHPRHARLSRDEDGWQIDWLSREEGEANLAPMRLEAGKAVPMGPMVIAVDLADAPWPTLEQLVLVPHAPALEPVLPMPAEHAPEATVPRMQRLRATALRPSVLTALATATVCISAVAFATWPPAGGHDGRAAIEEPAETQPPKLDPAQKSAIENAVKQAGAGTRVKLEASNGRWAVRAYALGEKEAAALSGALAKIEPRPSLRLTSEQDLRDEVADAIDQLASNASSSVSVKYLGAMRMRLEGRMASSAEKEKLLRSLGEAFPFVADWDDAVATADGDANGLVDDLRSRGWVLDGSMKSGTMELEVQLLQRDVPKWEQSLQAALQAHAVPFRANLTFVQAPPEPRAPAEARLPFDVRSVVGGEMPYVLLQDGEKLARGGVRQGWRLAGISVNQVVFENNGRRAVLQR